MKVSMTDIFVFKKEIRKEVYGGMAVYSCYKVSDKTNLFKSVFIMLSYAVDSANHRTVTTTAHTQKKNLATASTAAKYCFM